MLRNSLAFFSRGAKAPSPFVNAALQLCQIKQAHSQEMQNIAQLPALGDGSSYSSSTTKRIKSSNNKARTVAERQRVKLADAAAMRREESVERARQLEQQFLEELEHLRPLFHSSRALQSSRVYSAKLYNALKYFKLMDDPMFVELSKVLGVLNKTSNGNNYNNRATMLWSEKFNDKTREKPSGVVAEFDDDNPQQDYDTVFGPGESNVAARRGGAAAGDTLMNVALAKVRTHGRHVQPEFMPSEFPAPSPDAVGRDLASMPDVPNASFKNRGHWVLREPGIAPTKATRRLDPW